MNFFYIGTIGIVAVVFFSWLVNQLPMEMPEEAEPNEKDWSKL
jgi:hypothetical protein